jgi:ABC-type antimicrobial peptide transport system permease subunit
MVTVDTLAAIAALGPPGFQAPPPGDVFVRFRPGVNKSASIADLGRRVANDQALITVPTQPSDVANFGQVRNLPQILAGLLGLVAAVTMAYLLVTGIQRRRRDLAVLKSIGLVPRQVSAAIAWQATTIVVVAAVIGLPLGLAAGRSAWAVVAGQMGVVIRPTVPLLLILGLVPAAVLIANLVAAGPAVAAGRIRPASVLRSE